MPAKKDSKKEQPAKKGKKTGTKKVASGVAKENDKVKVEYEGSFDSGEVFDSSAKHGESLIFVIGGKQVIPGFENAVIGLSVGEEKKIRLDPSEAYGDPNPQLVKQIPKNQVPADREIKPGMMLVMALPNGMEMPAKVIAVDSQFLTIDLNHPLAGKALNFRIKLVEIIL